MKNQNYVNITPAHIGERDAKVVEVWESYLKRYEVRLPKENTAKRVWLSILLIIYEDYDGGWIHKDDVAELTLAILPNLNRDQQVRHLKRDGWNVESAGTSGRHRFYDPYRPSPEWENDRLRAAAVASGDFDTLKRAFAYRCATCGAKEGEPDVRYGSQDVVALQQGHRDPAKRGTVDNILPQCQFCNRAYRDDFVFNEKGRVTAVATVGPVQRASASVRSLIYDFLHGELHGKLRRRT